MKFRVSILLVFLLINSLAFSQGNPKREMRGVWIAALGIDWPNTRGTSASAIASQKSELINIFEQHKASGMNAMFLHMRPKCDALYKSSIEPWSADLTGSQGEAPSDPNYDPLAFAVVEAHKRGLELHAWLNPYRALASSGDPSSVAANNVIKTHPDWIIKCNGSEYRFLDPGLPQVRDYLVKVVMDIVRRYDVDGIHFDDYFYAYTDYGSYNDDNTFKKYSNGFTDKGLWRTNNVDLLLKVLNDSIKAVKPWIKFGISPSGNNSVNSSIYVNCANWLSGKYTDTTGVPKTVAPYIDYILPQLYWQGFSGYLPLWSSSSFLNGRHLYIGHAAYRLGESGWSATELSDQVKTSRANQYSSGGVYFSSKSLTSNISGCQDTLRHNYYANAALVPQMTWMPGSQTKPNAPKNIRGEVNSSSGKYELRWDKAAPAADGDTAFLYVVYRFESTPTNLNNGSNIFGTTGDLSLSNSYARFSATKGNIYTVTAVDRYGNESDMSNVFSPDVAGFIPATPLLSSPKDGDQTQAVNSILKWKNAVKAESYSAQVSTKKDFSSDILLNYVELKDTTMRFNGLTLGNTYYWRIKAHSYGQSAYSDVWSFQAGYPYPPVLALPAHASTNVPLNPVFKWFKAEKATSYHFSLSTSSAFAASGSVIEANTTDTIFTVKDLLVNKMYYWRIKSTNMYGESVWSQAFGFRTVPTVDVKEEAALPSEFELKQNYPNPFNPSTKITYSVPVSGFVTLKVFDVLGNEIETLVNQEKNAGVYNVNFPMQNKQLPSGVYFYKLTSGNLSSMKKMLLIK